ncbi:MAG: ABC transporter transmembrane domain-containing protein [Mycoplasmoidaceae bacterium]
MRKENKINTFKNGDYYNSWKLYLKYYKKNWIYLVLIIIFTIITTIATIFIPIITQLITSSAEKDIYKELAFLSGMLGLIVIVKIVLHFLLDHLGHTFDLKLELQIRRDMLEKFHKLPMERIDNTPSGTYFYRLIEDLKEVNSFSYSAISDLITIIILSVGGFIYIFLVNWIIGVVVISIYLISVILYLSFFKKLSYMKQQIKSMNSNINVEIGANIDMISQVKSSNSSLLSMKKFDYLQKKLSEISEKFFWKLSLFKMNGFLTSLLITVLTLIVGAFLVANKTITNAELIGLIASANILVTPVEKISTLVNDTVMLNASIVRIKEFYDWDEEENHGTLEPNIKGDLEFQNVCFSYLTKDKKIEVLKNLNFKVKKNKRNLIYGKSKSGKSTILKLIMNYYNVDSGQILIDNVRISNYKIDHLRKRIGYQSFFPKLSLEFEDINIDHDKLLCILEDLKINIDYFYEAIIKNPMNSQGLQISDSEKEMFSIGYVIYDDPDILLFDSIESILDDEQIKLVNKTLNKHAKNKTIIFTSNNIQNKFKCENIIKLK